MCYTYIIRCKNNSLYTGYTTDIERRMKEHKQGINSKYTKAKGFEKLEIYFESNSKSEAMKLEYYIKRQSRSKKIWIINNPSMFIEEVKDLILDENIRKLQQLIQPAMQNGASLLEAAEILTNDNFNIIK